MTNDNETVARIHDELKHDPLAPNGAKPWTHYLADRILAAHNREMNDLARQKTDEAHEAFVRNAELANAIVAKDRQLEAASADAEVADAEIYSLRNKIAEKDAEIDQLKVRNIETQNTVDGRDKEIAALRALVKDLADALNASCDCHRPCDGCEMADESKFDCAEKAERKLVARAREACK